MISAASTNALQAGDFTVVMGELHFHTNTLELHSLLEMNPRRDEVLKGLALDYAVGRVAHTPPSDTAGRAFLTPLTDLPGDMQLVYEETSSAREPAKTASVGELHLCMDKDELYVETSTGDKRWPVFYFVDQLLTEFNPAIVASDAHTPRITIDEVVVSRESWRFSRDELSFLPASKRPFEVFRGVNRWASKVGLPRHCFYRPSSEEKPLYLDRESPLLVELFAHAVAKAERVSISEMLPEQSGCWLTDPNGEVYTAELRTAIVDPLQWSPHYP